MQSEGLSEPNSRVLDLEAIQNIMTECPGGHWGCISEIFHVTFHRAGGALSQAGSAK